MAWSDRLTTELANLSAALSWALGGQDPEAGRELAARLARWWIATGRFSEAGQCLATALGVDAPAPPQVRALLEHGTGGLAEADPPGRPGPRCCWPTRPMYPATWPSSNGMASARSSWPAGRPAGKASPSP